MALSIKRLPSEVSPRMATNRHPSFTRRESYSTLLTSGFPLCARISAPSSRCWKVIAQNYMAGEIPRGFTEDRRDGRAARIAGVTDYQGDVPALLSKRYS